MKKVIYSFVIGALSGVLGWSLLVNKDNHSDVVFAAGDSELLKYQDLFYNVYGLVKQRYVEEVPSKKLMVGAIRGMLGSLEDPHTRLLAESQLNNFRFEAQGSFGGIGVEVSYVDRILVVMDTVTGSPAAQAGLVPGDRIVGIDGKQLKKMNFLQISGLMRGKVGAGITLQVKRQSVENVLDVYMVRQLIKLDTLRYTNLSGDIGYLQLRKFSRNASKEFIKAVKELQKQGADKLVLDLRNNPGGLLDEAFTISDLFLTEGQSVVATRGRIKAGDKEFKAGRQTLFASMPVVVLVNNYSASAAEIVGAAIQQNGRGKLVGEKTFGKGSVQTIHQVGQGFGLALTVQQYFTPNGKSIHKVGIEPDIKVKQSVLLQSEYAELEKVRKNKLLVNFAKKQKRYDARARNLWFAQLVKKKIKLTKPTADFILKRAMHYQGVKTALVDVNLDNQLKRAIREIKK